MNFISGSAKLAIAETKCKQWAVWSRCRSREDCWRPDCGWNMPTMKWWTLCRFSKNIWAVEEVLCSVGEDGDLDVHIWHSLWCCWCWCCCYYHRGASGTVTLFASWSGSIKGLLKPNLSSLPFSSPLLSSPLLCSREGRQLCDNLALSLRS